MSPVTDGAFFACLIIFALLGVDSDLQIREQTRALQHIADSTGQIVRDNAAEQTRLDKQDERMEEMLEHMAGVSKRGKK